MTSPARSSIGRSKTRQGRKLQAGKRRAIIIHRSVPGRVRFQVYALYRNPHLAEQLKVHFAGLPGVIRLSSAILTARLLVFYNPEILKISSLDRRLNEVLSDLPSERANLSIGQVPNIQMAGQKEGMEWDRISPQEALQRLHSTQTGLTASTANDRIREFGLNQLPRMESRSEWSIFLEQLTNLPTALLLGSAAISLLTGGLADSVVILGVVIVNGWIGYLMESSAEKTIGELISGKPQKIRVLRDGVETEVFPERVTRGDILVLLPGMTVAADAKILISRHLNVDESILTGESAPVLKTMEIWKGKGGRIEDFPPVSATSLVFRGTQVMGGSGCAVVFGIGSETQIGKIQTLMGSRSPPETRLQAELRLLGQKMVVLSLSSSSLIFLLAFLRGYPFSEIWRVSVALAIAAIPESLPTIATTTLARGVKRLSKQGVLVRHLAAVETMGNVDLVCLDKTGTLTLNQMTVVEVATVTERFRLTSDGFFGATDTGKSTDSPTLRKLLEIVTLCNEAEMGWKGSSTELALLRAASSFGISAQKIRRRSPLVETQYRAEHRGYMVTLHRRSPQSPGPAKAARSTGFLVAMKGRPDQVLALCSFYHLGYHSGGRSGEKVIRLSEVIRNQILAANLDLARQGLRVLGVAYKDTPRIDPNLSGLVWVGLVGLADPIRNGMRPTIRSLHRAGIRTTMITGDQKETAVFIGKQLGLSDEVYSRVSPSAKLEIIENLQGLGHVVAMIGDGINDGPALKIADVGIAMGGSGAETATRVADIVLLNDQLEKIMTVLREGRTIGDNIHKAVGYILTQNLAEIIFSIFSMLFGVGQLLSPMQILWMNLVTDIFPELALAQEPPAKDILSRPPRSGAASKQVQAQGWSHMPKMLFEAGAISGTALAGQAYGRLKYGPGERARTLSFLLLVTSSLFYSLNCRSEKSVFSPTHKFPTNPLLPLSIVLGLVMEGVGLLVPGVRRILGSSAVSAGDLWVVGCASLFPLVLIEGGKISAEIKKESSHGIV